MKNTGMVLWAMFAVCFLWAGCGSSKQMTAEKYSHKYYENKRIVETRAIQKDGTDALDFEIADGEKLVFEYSCVNTEASAAAGTEVKELVVFELNKSDDNVYFLNAELTNANCHYKRICECAGAGAFKVFTGKIKAHKLQEGAWEVEIDITATGVDRFTRDNVSMTVNAMETFKK